MTIICKTCGEPSGAKGTSMYGSCHKYGPTTHKFNATYVCPRCSETSSSIHCKTCKQPKY